jgi:hypothetical protein
VHRRGQDAAQPPPPGCVPLAGLITVSGDFMQLLVGHSISSADCGQAAAAAGPGGSENNDSGNYCCSNSRQRN